MRTKTLMFLITYRCNLRCSYCYEPKIRAPRIDARRLKALVQAKAEAIPDEYDSFEVHFMGGEPLLEFGMIRETAEWIWTQDFGKELLTVFAPTNGTLLTEEIKSWCMANRERFCLGLSFDGDETMQDLNRCASSGQVDLGFFASTWPRQSVKMTVSPRTVGKLAEGVRFLHSRGFRTVSADLAQGRDIGWDARALHELSRQLDLLSEHYAGQPDTGCSCSMLDVDIHSAGLNPSAKSCSCGEDLVCIDTDGREYACHLFSPVALPPEKARRSQEFDFRDKASFSNPACNKCMLGRLCTRCYGMNYITTGDVSRPDPAHCTAFKLIYLANCRHRLRLAETAGDRRAREQIAKLINLIS